VLVVGLKRLKVVRVLLRGMREGTVGMWAEVYVVEREVMGCVNNR